MNKKLLYTILLLVIFAVAFFVRFYRLGEIPFGLQQDETSIGYNSYSILETVKDEHGQTFPLYFKAFGEYKLPVIIYSSILPIKLWGLSEFSVRFISGLTGFITVVVFYFLVSRLFPKNEKMPVLFATALFALNPWHIHFSRGAFEVTPALFFIVAGTYCFIRFSENKNQLWIIGSIALFVLSMYTYNIARLFSPAVFLFLFFLYRKKFDYKQPLKFIIPGLVALLLLLPFFITFFSNSGFFSTQGTLIFSSAQVQSQLIEFRSYLTNIPSIVGKLFFNSFELTILQYLQNVFSYFSASFLFVSGSFHGNHGIGTDGQFYFFESICIIVGLVLALSKKYRWGYLFIGWAVIIILIASLTREAPHATRSFFLIVPVEVLSGYGLYMIVLWLRKNKNATVRILLFSVGSAFIVYNLLHYFVSYYVRFPISYAKAWRSEDKKLSLYLLNEEPNYEKIIIDPDSGFLYSSLLFFTKYSPQQFQKSVTWSPDDSEGFSLPRSFGKYEFRPIDWKTDYETPNTLLIIPKDSKPKDIVAEKIFYYPPKPVVIAVKGQIMQYPEEEIAYEVVKSK